MTDTNLDLFGEKETPFNLRLFFFKYLRYWYWFVLSLVVCLGAAYINLRYATPIYQVNATLLIKNQKSSTDDILKELETSSSANKIVENEIEVLKSRNLMQRVVDDLNLTVAYFQQGQVRSDEEIYGTSPIRLLPGRLTPAASQGLFINVLTKQQFELQDAEGNHKGRFAYGQSVNSDMGTFRVFMIDSLYRKNNDLIKVTVDDRESVAQRYKTAIQVQLLNPKSTVLKLTIEDAVPIKGKAILNSLLAAYNYSTLTDKNRESANTIQFIDERLSLITGELGDVERDVESYKSAQGITDLSEEATLYLGKVNENDAELNKLDIQAKVLEGVENYLKGSQTGVAPATLMVSDPILLSLLSKLNELEAQQEKYQRSVQSDSPFLQTVNAQIASTKSSIRENLTNQKNNLALTRASLNRQNNRFTSSIRTIPRKEREFITIKRQQGIKESLYLLLLQKKEETAISYASTVTDSRMVDDPYSPNYPIKPNKTNIYLIAFLAGLLIPVGFISVRDMLNDKIQSRREIENETGLSVFGEIMKKPKEMKDNIVNSKTNSVIAEQFKILRANLQYTIGTPLPGSGKTILITSSISGEGKSFISINLAASIALLDKRVIVLELDLRKPKISTYLGVSRDKGISNYLIGQGELNELIKPTALSPNMFMISSGPIPPNPSELLSNGRLETLLTELRQQFDYVLIDTPPVGLVADATLLGPLVDTAFYVVRHEYTPRTNMRLLGELKELKKFKSLNIVFNGVNYRNSNEYGYGYGYGYSYGKGYYV